MSKILSILLVIFSIGSVFSQIEYPEDKVEWDFSIEQDGCNATLVGKLKVVDHWHINATKLPEDNFGIPTTFKLVESDNYKLVGGVIEPAPHKEFDKASGEHLSYHEGSFTLRQKIKVLSEKPFVLEFDFGFQPCDSVKCLMPFEDRFKVKVNGCSESIPEDESEVDQSNPNEESIDGGEDKDTSGISSEGDEGQTSSLVKSESKSEDGNSLSTESENEESKDSSNRSLWWVFGVAFASGFIALLTPCVFPMIPMTVSFFTKQSKTKAAGIKNAIIYSLSIIVIYVLLGTVIVWIWGPEAMNAMSTNPIFNFVFFMLLIFFAVSFLGAFEIRLPSSWANKADQKADKGGLIGIFFMALALALVSFSCTGPVVGAILFQSATEGGLAPVVGMFGFSLALSLPFGLFAAFPGWMNTLPKSGGWLNSVKVVLGFLELALAFKFLSMADLSLQAHLLERELFLAIWIGIFIVLAMYLFGFIKMPHDSPLEKLSVSRALLGTFTLVFVLYLLPGLWGAPLKIISAFPPPMSYSESPMGVGAQNNSVVTEGSDHIEGTHRGPQNIMVFHDYDKAQNYAEKVGKPIFLDFTGHTCVNCRRMEESVWGEPGIIEILRNDVVIVSLYVDDREELPEEEQGIVTYPDGREFELEDVGDKWMYKLVSEYQTTAQPYYRMQDPEGNDLSNGSADYENHNNAEDFKKWLDEGLEDFNKED